MDRSCYLDAFWRGFRERLVLLQYENQGVERYVTVIIFRWLITCGILAYFVARALYNDSYYGILYMVGAIAIMGLWPLLTPRVHYGPDGNPLPVTIDEESKPPVRDMNESQYWFIMTSLLLIGLAFSFIPITAGPTLRSLPIVFRLYFSVLSIATIVRLILRKINNEPLCLFPIAHGKPVRKHDLEQHSDVSSSKFGLCIV